MCRRRNRRPVSQWSPRWVDTNAGVCQAGCGPSAVHIIVVMMCMAVVACCTYSPEPAQTTESATEGPAGRMLQDSDGQSSDRVSGCVVQGDGALVTSGYVDIYLTDFARGAELRARCRVSDGIFTWRSGDLESEVLAGKSWILVAGAPGCIGAKRLERRDRLGAPFRTVLYPVAQVEGCVVDDRGAAVVGAGVAVTAIQSGEEWTTFAGCIPVWSARSAASGAWQIRQLPEGAQVWLTVSAGGYQTVEMECRAGESRVMARLQKGLEIVGKVIVDGGAPAAGAIVRAVPERVGGRFDEQIVAQDGSYLLSGLGAGRYWVSALRDQHRSAAQAVEITHERPKVSCGHLLLEPCLLVEGRMLASDKQRPRFLEDVFLRIVGGHAPLGESVYLAADGTFFLWLTPGQYELQPGYLSGWHMAAEVSFMVRVGHRNCVVVNVIPTRGAPK
jgi:hypothetical protein